LKNFSRKKNRWEISSDRNEKEVILSILSGGEEVPLASREEKVGYFHCVWISKNKERLKGKAGGVEGQIQDRFVFE
jgi:hypothetical protein